MTVATARFPTAEHLARAQQALHDAGAAARGTTGQVPADLTPPKGWRWRVLADLTALSTAVAVDYQRAQAGERRHAWQARLAGPGSAGATAAVGSVVSAAGAGLFKTSLPVGIALVVIGVAAAFGGAFFSASNYVRERNQTLRFERLLRDIWDFAYLVLPTAEAPDVYAGLGALRTQWETAGS